MTVSSLNNFSKTTFRFYPDSQNLRTCLVTSIFLAGLGAVIASSFRSSEGLIAFTIIGGLALFYVLATMKRTPQGEEVSEEISLKKDAPEFSWEEFQLLFSRKHAFGLRHVSSLEIALKDQKEGFFGDALNLDPTDVKTWENFAPLDTCPSGSWTEREKLLFWPERFDTADQKRLMQFWKDGVTAFIDNPYYVSYQSAFLLIDYEEGRKEGAYDFHYGKGLGKKGKSQVLPEMVVSILLPPQRHLAGDDLTHHYFNSLLEILKKIER